MNCRRVAHDLTELEEGNLPFLRKLGLRAHKFICPACRAYIRQMHATVDALGEASDELPTDESQAIAARARAALRDASGR